MSPVGNITIYESQLFRAYSAPTAADRIRNPVARLRDHSRKTMEITEVVGYENGEIVLNPLYVFEEDEKSTLEKVHGSLKRTQNPMKHTFKLQLTGIKETI